MTEPDLPKILDELADLLRHRLQIRGPGFAVKLRRAGRLLPRQVRRSGKELNEMARLWDNPKLRRRVDPLALAQHAKVVRDHLTSIDRADLRRGYWLGVATPLAFNLLLLFLLVLVFANVVPLPER